jgi:YidC/Oxa1 family membrane protein insertase
MVATQIVQTRMTSVATDPNQKAMMYLMPVIMTFFFWSMPSGVTLYWTTQNFFSIAQQYYTNRFVETKKKQKETITVTQASTNATPPVIRKNNGPRKGKR